MKKANDELPRIWQGSTGHDPQAKRQLSAVDKKIANLRQAIENGLEGTAWAEERIRALTEERGQLVVAIPSGKPPLLSEKECRAYARETERVLGRGSMAKRKRMVRSWVGHIQLAPDRLEVTAQLRLPEPVVLGMVAGARYVAEKTRTTQRRQLRAALDWSYELLPPELRGLFASLSVFRGGWSARAAGIPRQVGASASL